MSMVGIGIAAGVAQGAVQSQHAAAALHRLRTDAATDAKRVRDRLSAHLAALDEGDEANLAQLHIDDQVPERNQSPYDQQREEAGHGHRPSEGDAERAAMITAEPAAAPQPSAAPAPAPADQLYRHLDITA